MTYPLPLGPIVTIVKTNQSKASWRQRHKLSLHTSSQSALWGVKHPKPHSPCLTVLQRTAVFKWLGAVAVILPKSQLCALLPHLMTSLVREMMVVEPSGDELRRLAKDVGDVMRRRVGTEEYTRQLARLQAQLEARRTGRKSKRAQEGRKVGEKNTVGDVLLEAFDIHVDHLLSELHPTSIPFLQYPDVVYVVHVSPIRGQCHEMDSADSKWRESLDKRIDGEFEVLTIFSEKNEEVTKVKDRVSALEITTSLHDAMVNELNQYSRINNIIIDGLAKVTDECVVDLVIKLGLELEVKGEPMDIDTAHRLQAKKSNVPSIIVKFTQRSIKESLLLNNHKLNHVNSTKPVNVAGHPLYISEHLIPLNNLWFYQARKIRDDGAYKYCWVKNGKIFLRSDDNSATIGYTGNNSDDSVGYKNIFSCRNDRPAGGACIYIKNNLNFECLSYTALRQFQKLSPPSKSNSTATPLVSVMKTTGDAKSRRAYEKPAPRKKPVPCFICDEPVEGEGVSLVVGNTPYSNTSFPAKIGQLMGDGFMVVVTKEDGLCRRCSALLNHLDKLEFDLAIVKKALTGYLKMKYQLLDEGEEDVTPPSDNTLHSLQLLDQLNKFSKVGANEDFLKRQYDKSLSGTRENHFFKPLDKRTLLVKQISGRMEQFH
uniref:Uncharacterized protein n=1 Tax=Timema genevievae TaxID=629358 RepID=A0A7R9JSY5_TIMGE|nr:unnamed protein product [Timema genevievae]